MFNIFSRNTDRDRFAKAVVRQAKARGWPHEIRYDRAQFCLHYGPDDATLFLQNPYGDWSKGTAESKRADVDRLVSAMFEGNDRSDLETALPLLLPVVRNRRELDAFWMNPANGQEREWWDGASKPICDILAVVIAIDRPSSLMLVDNRKLREWGASFTPLLERAIMNLREKSPTLFERDRRGFYTSQYNDLYDCSRLLIPELFDFLSLNGDPVAVPVARNGLVVAGSNEKAALCAMAQFVEEELESAARPIAYMPLVLRDKTWRIFEAEDPDLEPVRDLAAKQLLWDYECQRELLQAHYTRQNREVFVGKIIAHKFGGRVYSMTTWTETVQTLLPRADAVSVIRVDGEWVMRSWEDFWSVCGDVLVSHSYYPIRFMTPNWMDEPRFDRLLRDYKPPAWLPEPADGTKLQ